MTDRTHHEHSLICQRCERTFDPGIYHYGCPECLASGDVGRLEVQMAPTVYASIEWPVVGDDRRFPRTMWDYRGLLPLNRDGPISLDEGGTPIVELDGLATADSQRLLLKNETVNPTWSFKDRLNSLLLSNYVADGIDRIATASTGNHGASTAAYAAIAGIEDVIVLLPPETDHPLGLQVQAYGGSAVITEYDERHRLLTELVDEGWAPTVNVTDPYSGLPYSYEAYKTIAFELVDQLPSVPDGIVMSIGAGDGFYGIWKGFRELHTNSIIDETPIMYAVQPSERPAVVEAVERGDDRVGTVDGPMPITTSAGGVSAGDHVLQAIDESDGDAFAIDRDRIESGLRQAGRHGVYLEPSSAITVAGMDMLAETGRIDDDATVVCIGTGAGVKWPEKTGDAVGLPPRIEPSIDALWAALDERTSH